jgi:phage N-6-adenine-methyltransferase
MSVHFMSDSNEWETPQDFFDKLNEEFKFTLDPCATNHNAKCNKYYTKQDDGLLQDWGGERVFMNPPYGREIGKWVKKAYQESLKGAIVVCLIPARTDTSYYHDYIFPYAEIRFIRSRMKFKHQNQEKADNAPFPSAIVIFDNKKQNKQKYKQLELYD